MEVNKNDKNSLDTVFRNQMQKHPDMKDDALAMWDNQFKKEVRRQNFLSLGFWHFNIYNVLAMAGVMVLILFFIYEPSGISKNSSSTLPDKKHSVINTDNDSIQNNKTISTETSYQLNTYKKPSSSLQKNIHASPIVASTRKDSLSEQNVSEPVSSSPQENTPPAPPVVKKEKRTIYVEKRDTIEAIDTIRSKKKWRQLNKTK